MRLAVSLLPCLCACGIESGLQGKDADPPPFDTGDSVVVDTVTDSEPPPVEEACNGVDDDSDGLVDEGFPDADANGRVDCLDATCPPLNLTVAGSVAIDAACEAPAGGGATAVVSDPWRVRGQWKFFAPAADPTATSAWSAPAIGNLDDDNGDGVIDALDTPEVVVVVHGVSAWVVAIDGATGIEKWAYPDGNAGATTAIVDVTGDGGPDVVTANAAGFTIALDGSGALEWTATELASTLGYFMISAADLDEDGKPEVIADNLVLDGSTGTLRWGMRTFGRACPYTHPAVGDVDDADDDQEVIYCGVVYDSDGAELWDSNERGVYGMWPLLVQADGDSQAELGMVGDRFTLWDDDGTQRFMVDYPAEARTPAPPCVGDFDGDGAAEVVFAAYPNLMMYELDGSLAWMVPMNDPSGLAGCSGFDLDGDGDLEVVYSDHTTFGVYDGATGATLYQDTDHVSYTSLEYPTVADIDGDGHAELISVNNWGDQPAVVAYEHDGGGWPPAGPTWGVYDFAVTNVETDGGVPRHPENSWERYNMYRARPGMDGPGPTPDLRVAITDVCIMDCTYGPGIVALQVWNEGAADVPAGALVTLYEDRGTGLAVVATVTLPEIWAGHSLDGIEVSLTIGQLGQSGFTAVIDDDGSGAAVLAECDETNNVATWVDGACP